MDTDKMNRDLSRAMIVACIVIPFLAFLTCWQMERYYQQQSGGINHDATFSPAF